MRSLRPGRTRLLALSPGARVLFLALTGGLLLVALVNVPTADAAQAPQPAWSIAQEVLPTDLPAEHEGATGQEGEGDIILAVSNLGDAPANGAEPNAVVIADTLPPGLIATAITAKGKNGTSVNCTLATLQCTFTGVLYPYQQLTVTIGVKVQEPAGTVTTLPNEFSVHGGGAPHAVARTQQLTISGAPTPFGVQSGTYQLAPYGPGWGTGNERRRPPVPAHEHARHEPDRPTRGTPSPWRCRET